MFTWLNNFTLFIQALFGTIFTWGLTALGAAGVFFTRESTAGC
jgi:hypothetical protein